MDDETKEKVIADVVDCPICKKWLAFCMVGREPDMEAEKEAKSNYWQEHKTHLAWHEKERSERLSPR